LNISGSGLPRYSVYAQQKLRFFTPREVLRLMGFPDWFQFPPDMPARQAYPLLGNSLNVLVVSELLRFMLTTADR
jgi:tRNA (cytosine38-C5)-methyltransferase